MIEEMMRSLCTLLRLPPCAQASACHTWWHIGLISAYIFNISIETIREREGNERRGEVRYLPLSLDLHVRINKRL